MCTEAEKHPIGIMPERICKYRITLYAFAKGNPLENEMEMNDMKSNRLNEMDGIFQLKSTSKKYL